MRFPTFSYADGTFELGRFGQAPVKLHFSFFISAFVLTSPFWFKGVGHGPMLVLAAIIIVFGSILLHELAHAVIARHYHVPAHLIEINGYGGLVHFDWRPRRMVQDMAITVAGPASNLLLAGLVGVVLWCLPQPPLDTAVIGGKLTMLPFHAPSALERLLRFACYLNAGLAFVNMLPAFPLDGGRLMYLVVARRWDDRTATLVVGLLGTVFAVISVLVTLMTLLAGFVVISPPSFQPNWDAIQAARRGQSFPV